MLELLPCPNTNCDLLRSVHAAMLSEKPETPLMQSLYLANGAIATGTVLVATRYFMESSNRNLYLLVLYMQTNLLSTILKHTVQILVMASVGQSMYFNMVQTNAWGIEPRLLPFRQLIRPCKGFNSAYSVHCASQYT